MIAFFVAGEPAPKGSTKSFPFKRKNGSIGVSTTNANPKTKSWQERVSSEAQRAVEHAGVDGLFTKGVSVNLTFCLTRPKSISIKKRPQPTSKPDLDKLTRAVLDGLTHIAYKDDSQVVVIFATKAYGDHGEPAGCYVEIKEMG